MDSTVTVVLHLAIVLPLLAIFNISVEPYKHNYRHSATHFIIYLLLIDIFTVLVSMQVKFNFGLITSFIMTSVYLGIFAL